MTNLSGRGLKGESKSQWGEKVSEAASLKFIYSEKHKLEKKISKFFST